MKYFFYIMAGLLVSSCSGPKKLRNSDYEKDVLIQTNYGDILVRLNENTPQHRDNFLKLTKNNFYKGILFHRVIPAFMIQAGDPESRRAPSGKPLGSGGPGYTVPAEIRPELFHKKGVIAAARTGDDVNPERASSGSHFYIVQGKIWTDEGLDEQEQTRLGGRKIPLAHREVYKSLGGTPHLDQAYTVFGEVIKGLDVVDRIAEVPTSKGTDKDRPLEDVIIKKIKLIKQQ